MNHQSKKEALNNFFKAMDVLREEGILMNKKDFTCQVGEWLVEMIYDGKRATSGIQKGWDVQVGDINIQVKTHAKREGNNNRWSHVDDYPTEKIDQLVLIVFTQDYKLKEFYNVPWESIVSNLQIRGKKNPRSEINWSAIKDFKVELDTLPNQEIISMFL